MNVILADAVTNGVIVTMGLGVAILLVAVYIVIKCFHKVSQGEALIRNGLSGTKVTFSGMVVWPIIHRAEYMDISVKRIAIDRRGDTGLICRDNLRADIQVAFFVRVNPTVNDVTAVAQSLGCKRASDEKALYDLFDSKFSEALKTAGKRFDFAELYVSRDKFKEEILQVIGRDLNGYVLEDAAIDYLEQTDKKLLNPNNILDAEGIKKITMLTAEQFELANAREREKDMTITKQNVEAQEAILELNKQLAEAEAKQRREIDSVQAREQAEAKRVISEQKEKAEKARIAADEQIAIAEENMQRQVIVAARGKERTDGVETERVVRDRELEKTERERLVRLAQLERDKVVEVENRELQNVIRERVVVEKSVALEEERIKDTREFASADRSKRVQITKAEEQAEQALVKDIKQAEAAKRAAEEYAKQALIDAEANEKASLMNAEAKKTLAAASVKEHAVQGIAEAEVMEAKAVATQKQGTAEATVLQLKFSAEAQGINEKADAMKKFHDAGKEHEEFKLRLSKDRDVDLAQIDANRFIAEEQAKIVAEGLRSARIEIVGGENDFFHKLVHAIGNGKAVDRMVKGSDVLSQVKDAFLTTDPDQARNQLRNFVSRFGMSSDDLKNLTISALIVKLMQQADSETKGVLSSLLENIKKLGLHDEPADTLDPLRVRADRLSPQ